jgi:glycosyltransferase involved in cell wall biosynthesis
MSVPTTSVILATFNNPWHLSRALCGYSLQHLPPDEIIIADDGSDDSTRQVVESWAKRMPVVHVWQEHSGFGKCAILNKAIAASRGDYLIFSDGDCIPEPDFVGVHAALATAGHFLSGGAVRLTKKATEQVGYAEITDGRVFTSEWLRRNHVSWRERLKLKRRTPWQPVLNTLSPTRATFNGNNSSTWRSDVLAVNGFDERMVYGGLDRDLGERMDRMGVTGRSIRYLATVIHLDHPRSYKSEAGIAANLRIRHENADRRTSWTLYGLSGKPKVRS